MKISLFSFVLICAFFFACDNKNTTGSTAKASNSKEFLIKELTTAKNLVEAENAAILEFRDRYMNWRIKASEAGLAADSTFQNKMIEYKDFGMQMHVDAKSVLRIISQQQANLDKLETAITPEIEVTSLEAIKLGKNKAAEINKKYKKMIEMENGIKEKIETALKR